MWITCKPIQLIYFCNFVLKLLFTSNFSGPERPSGYELLGLSAEEALAERQVSPHQVHHGQGPEALLENDAKDIVINTNSR